MKKTVFIAVALLALVGCMKRAPVTYTYTKFTPPTDVEGKKCIMECEKIKLMKLQVSEQRYTAKVVDLKGGYLRPTDMRDYYSLIADIDYEKCYRDCGGKTEKATGSY